MGNTRILRWLAKTLSDEERKSEWDRVKDRAMVKGRPLRRRRIPGEIPECLFTVKLRTHIYLRRTIGRTWVHAGEVHGLSYFDLWIVGRFTYVIDWLLLLTKRNRHPITFNNIFQLSEERRRDRSKTMRCYSDEDQKNIQVPTKYFRVELWKCIFLTRQHFCYRFAGVNLEMLKNRQVRTYVRTAEHNCATNSVLGHNYTRMYV